LSTLTLFAVPKAFHGHIGVIQTNALKSWTRLHHSVQIILFGSEKGTAEKAARFGVEHVAEVSRNEYGTPLLDDIFSKAQTHARHDVMCYVNADIILMSDFVQAVEAVHRRKRAFLLVGQRWNVDVRTALDFSDSNWQNKLRRYVTQSGSPTSPEWIDYFVFPRGFYYRDIPPFAIGRAGFDNWLLWKARSLRASLIDASEFVMAVHQNHDYAHHPQGQKGVWEGAEAQRNRELMGQHYFILTDCSHRLTQNGLKPNFNRVRYIRIVRRGLYWLINWLMVWTRPFRDRFGLHRRGLKRVLRYVGKR